MRFLPVGLDLRHKTCLVVGGGVVGTRKVRTLLEAGANVKVVSPAVSGELSEQIEEGRVQWVRERIRADHFQGAFLVVMATDDPSLNAAGVQLASQHGALACDASSARHSQLIFGALLEHDGVTVATFTDGMDPSRARRTRDEIARLLEERGADGARPNDSILVVVASGRKDRPWSVPLEELMASLQDEVGACTVQLAYNQFGSPTLREVVDEAARSGVRRVCVLPLFMLGQGHVDRDIRPLVTELRQEYPNLHLELLPPLGEHASFAKLLAQIAKEATS